MEKYLNEMILIIARNLILSGLFSVSQSFVLLKNTIKNLL